MPWRPQGTHNLAWWPGLLAPTPVVASGRLTPDRAVNAAYTGRAAIAVASDLTATPDQEAAALAY